MTIRFYLVPVIGTGANMEDARRPAYFAGSGIRYSCRDYGLMPVMLVCADTTTQQHNNIIANSDVTAIPTNIDNNITAGALTAVREALENLRIPGNWVDTSHTYRQVLRVVTGVFQLARRHFGLHNKKLFADEITLDDTWGSLPVQARTELQATADSFGWDYSGVTSGTLLRTILKNLAEQWGTSVFHFGLTTL